jgi:hypothetical protein
MGANIIKIKPDKNSEVKKPLTPLQKKLLEGPTMTPEEYKEFKKVNKWMRKWKI